MSPAPPPTEHQHRCATTIRIRVENVSVAQVLEGFDAAWGNFQPSNPFPKDSVMRNVDGDCVLLSLPYNMFAKYGADKAAGSAISYASAILSAALKREVVSTVCGYV